jgi:phage recombination protein Bet
MNETQAITRQPEEKAVAFVPFGAMDQIKLSVSIVKKLIAVPTKSGKFPDDIACMKFVMLCQAQRLNPFAGDAFLIGYDGKDGPSFSLVTAHQAFLKRAESHEDFDGMESGVIVADKETGKLSEIEGDFYETNHEVVGGWAKVYRKKRSRPTYRRLRLERFNKGFGEWNKDAAGMICKCAEADALRSTFPTLCGGLYLENEMAKGAIDVTVAAAVPVFGKPRIAQLEPSDSPQIENTAQQEPPAQEKPLPASKLTPQQQIGNWMDDKGVSFEDFRDWLKTTGTLGDAESYGELDALPGDVCQGLLLAPAQLAKCAKIYGGNKKAAA